MPWLLALFVGLGGMVVAPCPASAIDPAAAAPEDGGSDGPAGPKVLWLVAEKWTARGAWRFPVTRGASPEAETLFAAGISQEAEDYPWRIEILAEDDAEDLGDGDGGVLVDRALALALAHSRNADFVVLGEASLEQGEEARLVAHLQLLDGQTGARLGEARRAVPLHQLPPGADLETGVLRLAALMVPELDRLVGAARPPGPASESGQRGNGGRLPDVPETARTPGSWLLIVRSSGGYGDWETVEHALRQRFPELKVVSLEIGVDSMRVELVDLGADFAGAMRVLGLKRLRLEVHEEDLSQRIVHLTLTAVDSTQRTP